MLETTFGDDPQVKTKFDIINYVKSLKNHIVKMAYVGA